MDTTVASNPLEPFSSSPELKDLFSALAKAQEQIKPAVMDMKNPHFNSRYASLTACQDAYRVPLSNNGFALVQQIFSVDDKFYIRSILGHISGQWIANVFKLITDKNSMQGLGSAITYGRRYGANSLIGIVDTEDDDGNGSGSLPPKTPEYRRPAPPKTPEQVTKPLTPIDELFKLARDKKLPNEVVVSVIRRMTGTDKKSTELNADEIDKVLQHLRLMN